MRTIKIVSIAVLSIVALYFVLNTLLEYRLTSFLDDQKVTGIELSYDDIELHMVSGSALVKNTTAVLNDSLGANISGKVTLDTLKIRNIGYLRLLFLGNLNLDAIELHSLSGTLHQNGIPIPMEEKDSVDVQKSGVGTELNLSIKLSHLVLKNTNIQLFDGTSDSLLLSFKNFNLDVKDILVDRNTISNSLPFICKDYSIETDSIFIKASAYENLTVSKIRGNHVKTTLQGFQYSNKYSTHRYSNILTQERDFYDIEIDSLVLENTSLESIQDNRLKLGLQNVIFRNPKIKIYRDKLVADEYSIKPMYSQTLRESGIDMAIDQLEIKDAELVYIERTEHDNTGGAIELNHMNVTIINLGNTYKEDTEIAINALFMGSAPLSAQWNFNVADTSDRFEFNGELDQFNVREINRFTEPTLNVDVSGVIHKLFFNIAGDNFKANTHLKVDYENLRFGIINKKRHRQRKFLSTVANVVAHNKSRKKNTIYKTVEIEVERDRQKSFFNFVSKNIEKGMAKAIL
ncbi:hypothetical protein [Pareuzebyella sediminis]|uniref:hypothetical protein n=1 Tax=Pareuzebyella sediminis TaxID=2607998 RepID=UPI0011EEE47C|nr:hypothetical protein [Pareuzebyella sediminis]